MKNFRKKSSYFQKVFDIFNLIFYFLFRRCSTSNHFRASICSPWSFDLHFACHQGLAQIQKMFKPSKIKRKMGGRHCCYGRNGIRNGFAIEHERCQFDHRKPKRRKGQENGSKHDLQDWQCCEK